MITCPECDSRLDYEEEELVEDDVIVCEECGAELRVVSTNPIELELVEEEEEEDEDYFDEDEEDQDWR